MSRWCSDTTRRSPARGGRPMPAAPQAGGPSDVKSEIESLRAENAAVRELLRGMEAQQKALIEQVDRLQRRLDAAPGAVVSPAAATQAPPEPPKDAAHNDDHYQ